MPRWTVAWLASAALGVVALSAMAATPSAAEQTRAPSEYEVKAAFLYNFTKYVEWPPRALPDGHPLELCVLGPDPFGTALDDTLRDETVQSHRLEARRIDRVEDSSGCQLVFVGDLRAFRLSAERPILTIGDVPGFAERGGMIGLRKEGNTIRFDINVTAIERAGLKISSQLLKLGHIVNAEGD